MQLLDIILGLTVFLVTMAIGCIGIIKMLDSRFPPAKFDVWDRGVRIPNQTFRLWGDEIIVKNDIFKLLLNEFRIMGTIRGMEYDRVGKNKVYRAYLHHGYLFAMRELVKVEQVEKKKVKNAAGVEEMQEVVTTIDVKSQPAFIELTGENGKPVGKVSFEKGRMLVPFKMIMPDYYLAPEDVNDLQDTAMGLMTTIKNAKDFNMNVNPFVNTVIACIPLTLNIVALGLVLWLTLGNFGSDLVQVSEASKNMSLAIVQAAEIMAKK